MFPEVDAVVLVDGDAVERNALRDRGDHSGNCPMFSISRRRSSTIRQASAVTPRRVRYDLEDPPTTHH
jgi:hypothetical protein